MAKRRSQKPQAKAKKEKVEAVIEEVEEIQDTETLGQVIGSDKPVLVDIEDDNGILLDGLEEVEEIEGVEEVAEVEEVEQVEEVEEVEPPKEKQPQRQSQRLKYTKVSLEQQEEAAEYSEHRQAMIEDASDSFPALEYSKNYARHVAAWVQGESFMEVKRFLKDDIEEWDGDPNSKDFVPLRGLSRLLSPISEHRLFLAISEIVPFGCWVQVRFYSSKGDKTALVGSPIYLHCPSKIALSDGEDEMSKGYFDEALSNKDKELHDLRQQINTQQQAMNNAESSANQRLFTYLEKQMDGLQQRLLQMEEERAQIAQERYEFEMNNRQAERDHYASLFDRSNAAYTSNTETFARTVDSIFDRIGSQTQQQPPSWYQPPQREQEEKTMLKDVIQIMQQSHATIVQVMDKSHQAQVETLKDANKIQQDALLSRLASLEQRLSQPTVSAPSHAPPQQSLPPMPLPVLQPVQAQQVQPANPFAELRKQATELMKFKKDLAFLFDEGKGEGDEDEATNAQGLIEQLTRSAKELGMTDILKKNFGSDKGEESTQQKLQSLAPPAATQFLPPAQPQVQPQIQPTQFYPQNSGIFMQPSPQPLQGPPQYPQQPYPPQYPQQPYPPQYPQQPYPPQYPQQPMQPQTQFQQPQPPQSLQPPQGQQPPNMPPLPPMPALPNPQGVQQPPMQPQQPPMQPQQPPMQPQQPPMQPQQPPMQPQQPPMQPQPQIVTGPAYVITGEAIVYKDMLTKLFDQIVVSIPNGVAPDQFVRSLQPEHRNMLSMYVAFNETSDAVNQVREMIPHDPNVQSPQGAQWIAAAFEEVKAFEANKKKK